MKKQVFKKDNEVYAVILAGGSGTRLWPLSRRLLPKQFMALYEGKTPLESTIARLSPLVKKDKFVIITNNLHAYGSAYKQIAPYQVIIEPEGKNTAPAIGIAAKYVQRNGADPVLIVSPSDHLVRNNAAFAKVLALAVKTAQQGRIVTLGIRPDSPETGYGYIKTSGSASGRGLKALPVAKFVEKPSLEKAEQYVRAGNYFWNAGIFVFRASVILEEIRRHLPELHKQIEVIARETFSSEGIDYPVFNKYFSKLKAISVDYGVMEKASGVMVIPCEIGWSDVGSWRSFYDVSPKDAQGNVSKGDVIAEDCHNSFLYSAHKLVTAIGLQNLALVETSDAILACPINRSQEVKLIVDKLTRQKRSQE
ncbi:MAG TPA: mannose-1-phosphate guanylyltransferase, partial [Elusimicrobiales bacterium]|nr:mannose-1-phosphate guanylyltransferase [Elusimicrobiales bacterium]